MLQTNHKRWAWLKHLSDDGAYDRTRLMDKAVFLNSIVEVVRRSDTKTGFEAIPGWSVVERTSGWMIRWRHLVRDYEKRLDVSEALIHVAMGALLLRRVAHRCFSNRQLVRASAAIPFPAPKFSMSGRHQLHV